MHKEVLNKKTERLLIKIKDICKNFYLVGGTGLALQIGHRKSIDLDWFSKKSFSVRQLKIKLKKIGKLKIIQEEEFTLNCVLDGVRLSFFRYPYKNISSLIKYENIKLASIKDIACMKIDSISSRGSKKDFIDLYFILKKFSLEELLKMFDKKYKGIEYNRLHILKSLSYFEEAEKDPMPIMLKDIKWSDVKNKIKEEVILSPSFS